MKAVLQGGGFGDSNWPTAPASLSEQLKAMFAQQIADAKRTEESAKTDAQNFRNQALQHDVQLGEPKKGSSGGGPTPVDPITDDTIDKTQDYEVAQKSVDAVLKSLTESELTYREAVKSATDATDQDNAEMALHRKVSDDAKEAVALLTGQLANEQDELRAAQAAHDSAKAAVDSSREAYNAYGASLGEGKKRSEESRAELDSLKKSHDEAKEKFEQSQHAIDGLTSTIEKNSSALAEAKEKTREYADAQAAIILAYNTGTQADQQKIEDEKATQGKSLEAQRAYWASQIDQDKAGYADGSLSEKQYYADLLADQTKFRDASLKLDEDPAEEQKKRAQYDRQLADERATDGLSIQQEIAYYSERYAVSEAGDSNARAEAEKYYEQIAKLEQDEYKQRIDAQKKFVDEAAAAETSLLDDIITKHQSFHSTLHDIFNEVSEDFIKMVEKMLVEAPLLTGMEKSLFNILNPGGGSAGGVGGGGTGGGVASAGAGASLFGAAGMLFGESGASSVVSQLDTSSFTSAMIGTSAAQQVASSTTSAAASGAGGTFDQNNPLGITGGPTSNYSGFPVGGSSSTNYVGGGLAGAGIGTTVGSLDGGNETGAGIGGALGGVLGAALHANPLIGAGIDVVSGLLGSLIGGHPANASDNPDEFEGQTGFGQDIADLRGGEETSGGSQYFASSAVEKFIESMGVGAGTISGLAGQGTEKQTAGGVASSGGVDAAEIWLSQNQKDTQQQLLAMGISPAQMASWEAMFGVSATGSGQLTQPDKNIGDVAITGATSGGGTTTTYTALSAALQQIMGASGGSSSTPVFSMTEAYPGAPSVLSSFPLGNYNPTTGAYTSASATSGATVAPGTTSTITPGQPVVNVTINGSVVGAGGIKTVSNEIAQALQEQQTGQVPGAASNSRAARYGFKS